MRTGRATAASHLTIQSGSVPGRFPLFSIAELWPPFPFADETNFAEFRHHQEIAARIKVATRKTEELQMGFKKKLEVAVGLEPTKVGFADHCLTTWRPRHRTEKLSVLSSQFSVRKKCAEASVLHLQTLGGELSFFIPNGCQFSVAVRQNNA